MSTVDTVVDIDLTYSQQKWLNILPRIGATISICCSLYLIYEVLSNKYYRTRIYHRIMTGCAINIILFNIGNLWGSAAVPSSTSDLILGANGTVATCSTQGFIFQFTMFVVPSYYVALSLLSYFSIQNNFQVSKYQYIEKWIHIIVYIFPLGSAIYLLYLEAYNHVVVTCYVASYPIGCGDQSNNNEIDCIRGPQNIGQIQILFIALPTILIVLIPTIVMLVLYLQVRNRPNGKHVAKSVAKQSGLYLLVQYWTYLFRFVDAALILAVGKYVFATNLLANTIEALQGLWTLMVYLYFRSAPPPPPRPSPTSEYEYDAEDDDDVIGGSGSQRKRFFGRQHNELSISFKGFIRQTTKLKDCNSGSSAAVEPSATTTTMANNQQSKELCSLSGCQSRTSGSRTTLKTASQCSSYNNNNSSRFSIFDGTNTVDSDSPWAAFLIDEGEDDDYDVAGQHEYDDGNDFDVQSGHLIMPPNKLVDHNDDNHHNHIIAIATTKDDYDSNSNDGNGNINIRDSETTVDTAPNSTRTVEDDV